MERILRDLQVFVGMSQAINSNLDLRHVLQAVTDAGTKLSGARFGAFFYNAVDEQERSYRLHVLSGAEADAFARMPSPRITGLFEPTFSGEGTVRIDDITTDPRIGGMPKGHLSLRSYLATPVRSRSEEVIGGLLFGHPDAGVFDQRSEDVVRLVATQAAVAVENARLFEAEQRARREAEQSVERLGLLQTITARLANAYTPEDALTGVVDTVVGPLRASRVGVYLPVAGGWQAVAGAAHDGRGPQDILLGLLPDDLATPVSAAAKSRAPAMFTSPQELAQRYPHLAQAVSGVGAAIALPVTFADTVSGVLLLAWSDPREFACAEVEMLSAAAGQLAAALSGRGCTRRRWRPSSSSRPAPRRRYRSRRRSSGPSCLRGCRRWTRSRLRCGTSQERPALRSAATGTTSFRPPTASRCSWWVTFRGTAWGRPR